LAAITINQNVAALTAGRYLDRSSSALRSTSQRLSSGLRINRASDDAAGLAIATSINADGRVYSSAVKNLNDGVSALSIASGALSELSNIVTRIKELAEQSSNGVLSDRQRKPLNDEAQQLKKEYDRILDTCTFNNRTLLVATSDDLSLQAGYGTAAQLNFDITSGLERGLGDGNYNAAVSLGGGSWAGIVAADFNGDGNADIIGGYNATELSTSLGNGDGTFKATILNNSGFMDRQMFAVDVNGDGKLDLLGTKDNALTNNVAVFIGNGNGTFGAITTYLTGVGAYSSTIGDFNSDGSIDIATNDINDGTVSVFLNTGNGTFGPRRIYTATPQGEIANGDINGDGNLDLVQANTMFLGNGNGTFKAGVVMNFGAGGYGEEIVDMNRDGYLDIVAATDGSSGLVTITLGNGNGTFKAVQTFGITATQPSDVETCDINEDGALDVALAISGRIHVYLGNGDGTLKASVSYVQAGTTGQLQFADFNNDEINDIISSARGTPGANVLFGTGGITTRLSVFNLSSKQSSLSALDQMTKCLTRINKGVGMVGASLSRVQSSLSNLQSTVNVLREVESRIMDADVAEESAKLARQNILQQAGASVLAQAKREPEIALLLLRG
jgi:flagellin